MILLKKKFMEKDYSLYFLLFFTPLINFVTNNLYFYNIYYFFDIFFIFLVLFLFIIVLFQIFSYLKLGLDKHFYLFFILWYLQFYYRDIYNYYDLDFNGDQIQKYMIVIFLVILSLSFFFFKQN